MANELSGTFAAHLKGRVVSAGRPGAARSAVAFAILVALWLALGIAPARAAQTDDEAAAPAPRFALPLLCTPGEDCFIQNYVDRDPGPGWRDFACGYLSYNGHTGTDFRLRDLAQMASGVTVVAAAPGKVVATRDGEPDVSMRERATTSIAGREAGNAVRIVHADGWETQYSHMRQGSIMVRQGQHVETGQALGLVGLSGKTEFPHLDFVVRRDGQALDPFAPDAGASSCATMPTEAPNTLWLPQVASMLVYRSSGVLMAGFAPEAADRGKAQRGDYSGDVAADAPILGFYVEVFGVMQGDQERIRIVGPDGKTLTRNDSKIGRRAAVRYMFTGRRLSSGQAWQAGAYTATYELARGSQIVASATRTTQVR